MLENEGSFTRDPGTVSETGPIPGTEPTPEPTYTITYTRDELCSLLSAVRFASEVQADAMVQVLHRSQAHPEASKSLEEKLQGASNWFMEHAPEPEPEPPAEPTKG